MQLTILVQKNSMTQILYQIRDWDSKLLWNQSIKINRTGRVTLSLLTFVAPIILLGLLVVLTKSPWASEDGLSYSKDTKHSLPDLCFTNFDS